MIDHWQAQAFNQDPDSDNQIHGDELAQAYGFEGGLVPGVTISAYLAHPAVIAWGERFLAQGCLHVRVVSPLYDGEQFAVTIDEQSTDRYTARLARTDGTVSAHAEASLPAASPPPPLRRGDPIAADDFQGPASSATLWRQLQENGCHAMRLKWWPEHMMGTYLNDRSQLPPAHQGSDALANTSFVLGVSNWLAAKNAYMNPWVHLQTQSQNYAAIPAGAKVIAEMAVTDLFERKGHRFFDARVNLFDSTDDHCFTCIDLRAIYQLRGSGG
ncbi:MAG: hypothetical protein Hals2KO_18890 [Halioglobus sp.]